MQKQKVCIISPTYNERVNVEELIKRTLKVFKNQKKYKVSLLIVDDNSPDRTWEFVQNFRKKHPNVFLIKKNKKEGIGAAYITGFKYCFKNIPSDIIFQMDADLSHPPEKVPLFLKELEKGYDVVIGSRYIKGGGCDKWTPYRKIVSRGANKFGKIVLNLKINDISSGFRCYRTNFLKSLDIDKIHAKGYSFLEELLFMCAKKNAKIKEIPFQFIDRIKGKTKLTKKEMAKFFINILKLRLDKY